MSAIDRIKDLFTESIQTKILSADQLPEIIVKGGEVMVESLLSGHKILS